MVDALTGPDVDEAIRDISEISYSGIRWERLIEREPNLGNVRAALRELKAFRSYPKGLKHGVLWADQSTPDVLTYYPGEMMFSSRKKAWVLVRGHGAPKSAAPIVAMLYPQTDLASELGPARFHASGGLTTRAMGGTPRDALVFAVLMELAHNRGV